MKLTLALLAAVAVAVPAFGQDSTIKTVPVYSYAGTPSNGTTEVQTLTIQSSTSGGTFKIEVTGGRKTDAITWTATDATLVARVDAALELLPEIGTGGVTTAAGTLSSGIGTITLTLAGKNVKSDFPLLVVTDNAITGGAAPAIAVTTAGVAPTFRSAPAGALLVNTSGPTLYQNQSATASSPAWVLAQQSAVDGAAIGYTTGTGGAVTQASSITTGVTLNKLTGTITTVSSTLAAGVDAQFTLTNSTIGANDVVVVSTKSYAGTADGIPVAKVVATAAGSCIINVHNQGAVALDAVIVINFAVIKGSGS